MWGAKKAKLGNKVSLSSSSSSSSSKAGSSSSTSGDGNNKELATALLGSSLVKLICLYFDHSGLEMDDAIKLIELVESDFAQLRVKCVELLFLEKDALKYYKDASYPYITSMCHILDSAINIPLKFAQPLPDLTSHTKLNKKDFTIIEQFLRSNFANINTMLALELKKFQKGLYKIPSDGGLIPDMFRRKKLIPFINMLSSQLDEDGFEVVNNYASLNLLSDVENEGLEESEEETFSSDDD